MYRKVHCPKTLNTYLQITCWICIVIFIVRECYPGSLNNLASKSQILTRLIHSLQAVGQPTELFVEPEVRDNWTTSTDGCTQYNPGNLDQYMEVSSGFFWCSFCL